MQRRVALLLCVAGCVSAPVPLPAPDLQAAPVLLTKRGEGKGQAKRPAPGLVNPSGKDIASILDQSGLAYVTLDPERRWMVAFAGRQLPKVVLYIVHGDEFTVVLGKLFTAGADAGVEFYRSLARKNYEFDQLKLSMDASGGVYASFEVPTRILDRQELLENIFGLAGAIDAVLPELEKDAHPLVRPDEDPPAEPNPPPPEVPEGSMIEALREALGPAVRAVR